MSMDEQRGQRMEASGLLSLDLNTSPAQSHACLEDKHDNSVQQQAAHSGRTPAGKRKRRASSEEQGSTTKPYECRFCPMKFAKSQALGGHMNRHRREREREQLLHARRLVMQQGWSSLMMPDPNTILSSLLQQQQQHREFLDLVQATSAGNELEHPSSSLSNNLEDSHPLQSNHTLLATTAGLQLTFGHGAREPHK